MRLVLTVFGAAWGLAALVSCEPYDQSPTDVAQPSYGGFLGTLFGLPKRIIVEIYKAIGAVLRFIFVRIPEGILDIVKRAYYRVAQVFGKKDPYDMPTVSPQGVNYNSQGYNKASKPTWGYSYGNPVYKNPYLRK